MMLHDAVHAVVPGAELRLSVGAGLPGCVSPLTGCLLPETVHELVPAAHTADTISAHIGLPMRDVSETIPSDAAAVWLPLF